MKCWLNRPRRKEEEIRWILSFSLQRVNEREKERESLLAFVVLKDGRTSAAVRELSLSLPAFHPLSHSLSMSLSHTFSRSPLPFGRAHHRQICQFFKHQRWNEVSKLWSYLRVVSLSLKKVTLFSFQCIRSLSLSLSHTHTRALSLDSWITTIQVSSEVGGGRWAFALNGNYNIAAERLRYSRNWRKWSHFAVPPFFASKAVSR